MLVSAATLGLLAIHRQDPAFPGLGCPDYNVESYSIKLRFDPGENNLHADVTMKAKDVHPISEIPIDFVGFDIDSVTVNGNPAKFQRNGQKLLVSTSAARSAGSSFTVETVYHGVPKPIASPAVFGLNEGWFTFKDGSVTVCEPNIAHAWFPCNDLPTQKATFEFDVQAPADYRVIANGVESKPGHFAMSHPSLTCMAIVAIGKYAEIDEPGPAGMTIRNFVPKGQEDRYRKVLDSEKELLTILTEKLGPYPWETCGTITLPDAVTSVSQLMAGAALETTSIPVFGPSTTDKSTLIHELCHQWMGDCVSVTHWAEDIWWVEGFAGYSEQLLVEHEQGHAAYLAAMKSLATSNKANWQAPGKLGVTTMFGNGSYVSGCLLFHALRTKLGDDLFFKAVRTFIDRNKYGNASDQDWIEITSKLTGHDMKPFFDSWLFGAHQPDLHLGETGTISGGMMVPAR